MLEFLQVFPSFSLLWQTILLFCYVGNKAISLDDYIHCFPSEDGSIQRLACYLYKSFWKMLISCIWCRNSRGYEMAKLFCSKFTHLSPVWYDLKRYELILKRTISEWLDSTFHLICLWTVRERTWFLMGGITLTWDGSRNLGWKDPLWYISESPMFASASVFAFFGWIPWRLCYQIVSDIII